MKISATSPTQIGGAKVTYTDKDGEFRIAALQPGVFTVVASAPKMTTFEQRGVNVGVATPAQVTIVLDIQTDVEQIKIVEKAPTVNVRNGAVKETFDEDFLDNLPLNSRDSYESVLENNTPGVAYGDSGRSRGGDSKANVFMMDGFRINSHGVQGVANQLATLKTVAAMEVQTAGYGAEYATAPGAVMNLVTKSGSNRYEVDVSGYHQNNKLQLREAGDSQNTSFSTKLNINFAGPIIRDRLWFFSTAELGQELSYRDADPLGLRPQLGPRSKIDLRGTLKLTWQVTPRNKLQTIQKVDYNDVKNSQGYSSAPDAQLLTKDQNSLHTLRWESLVTDNLLVRPGVAYNRFWRHWAPESCRNGFDDCLDIQPYNQTVPFGDFLYNNYTEARQLSGQSVEVVSDVDYFLKSSWAGDHDLRLTGRYYREIFEELRTTPAGSIIYYNGTVPDRRVWWYSNDPRVDGPPRFGWNIQSGQAVQAEVALQDSFRPTRYTTFTPGVAFVNAGAIDRNGTKVLSFNNFLPSISAAWDATHDGRTSLRGSASERTQLGNADMGRFALGSRTNLTCRWDANNQDFTNCMNYGGDNGANKSFGSPCGPDGVDEQGRDCRHKVKAPKVREFTVGAEREVVQGVAVGGDFIYRYYYNLLETQETNRVWNSSGTALDPIAPYKDGRNTTYSNLDNAPGARRDYKGLTLSVRKREGKFRAQFGYTLSFLKGNVLDQNIGFQTGNQSAYGDNSARDALLYGYLPDDARHSIRSGFVYQFTSWFSSGLTWNYTSGRPYSRKFRNDVDNGFTDYRSRVGEDPGGNINDPGDDRPVRRPDITEVNLQLRSNLKPLIGYDSELYLDVLNVLAQRTTTAVIENDGPRWGATDGRTLPFRLRLGFRFKY